MSLFRNISRILVSLSPTTFKYTIPIVDKIIAADPKVIIQLEGMLSQEDLRLMAHSKYARNISVTCSSIEEIKAVLACGLTDVTLRHSFVFMDELTKFKLPEGLRKSSLVDLWPKYTNVNEKQPHLISKARLKESLKYMVSLIGKGGSIILDSRHEPLEANLMQEILDFSRSIVENSGNEMYLLPSQNNLAELSRFDPKKRPEIVASILGNGVSWAEAILLECADKNIDLRVPTSWPEELLLALEPIKWLVDQKLIKLADITAGGILRDIFTPKTELNQIYVGARTELMLDKMTKNFG